MQVADDKILGEERVFKTPIYTRIAIRKYNSSKKGKLSRKKYVKKHRKEVSDYNKKYMKNRREKAKLEGLCPRCLKVNPESHLFINCVNCRDYFKNKNGGKEYGRNK
jgi:hypothetical protein